MHAWCERALWRPLVSLELLQHFVPHNSFFERAISFWLLNRMAISQRNGRILD
jgi:hypothetical protein